MSIRRAYVDVADGQLHYRKVAGDKRTPIVFLHQVSASSVMYERLMSEYLAHDSGRSMFALDMPGFGASFFPPDTPTTAYYTDVYNQALVALGIERAHVFGHHTGAMLGGELCVTHPEKVVTLTLAGPWYADEDARTRWRENGLTPLEISADGSHMKAMWDRLRKLDPQIDPRLLHREVVDNLRAGERYHEAYQALTYQDFRAILAEVACPVMVIGAERDVLFPHYESVLAAKPEARGVLLEGAGTFAVDDEAPKIAAELARFIADNE